MMAPALYTFMALLATTTLGQDSQVLAPPSPCPTVFTYDLPGPEPGWWSGVVNLSTDSLLHSLWLDIVLDNQAYKLLHKMVEAVTQDFKYFMIENEDMQIQPGIPISLRFSVQYDTNGEVPRVQTIRLNGIEICNALSTEEQTDSSLKTNINSNMEPVVNPSKQSINPVYNRSDPGNISNAGDKFSGRRGQQTQCGTSTSVSRWPWVVGIHGSYELYKEYFIGGNLLSHRHVITTTRVVDFRFPKASTTTEETNLMVYLGQRNISSFLGVQIRVVQKILVSPDYMKVPFGYSEHDVALLVLQEPVTYTDWVRPVCLWPPNEIDLEFFVGKKGWLLGWGHHENGMIEQLSEVEISVVSEERCFLYEGYLKYNPAKTNYSYCAGNKDDTYLCRGVNQGNGMVLKMGDSWYLRGHITFYILSKAKTTYVCNSTNYLVFTDIAISAPWIHSIVSDYI